MLARHQDGGVQALGSEGLDDGRHLDDFGAGSHDGKDLGGQRASFLGLGGGGGLSPLLTLAEPGPGAKIRPGV